MRYLFVKNRIDKGDFLVTYCPSQLVLTNFFTKPLIGKKFFEFKSVIMGYKKIFDFNELIVYPIKEHVEINGNS